MRSEAERNLIGGPVVVGANWYQFRRGESLINRGVESVSFVWVVHGIGLITTGGRTFAMTPNNILRLPWEHSVEYQADSLDPYRIGTLHLVPLHDFVSPVEPRVAHLAGDPLLQIPSRSGDCAQFLASMSDYSFAPARRIIDLGNYAVQRSIETLFDEDASRALGQLVSIENRLWTDGVRTTVQALPPQLTQMMGYIRSNLRSALSVDEVATAGNCSKTTAQRLFKRYTGVSLRSWIGQVRLREAAHLLRTSGLMVREVSAMVGFADPMYFSRAFRADQGVPPSKYGRDYLRP